LSTFWVITALALPRAMSSAIARWPVLGLARSMARSPSKRRRQDSWRTLSLAMNS
jgi:hypothetical protein